MIPAVSVRARFERFPATVKGAFIVRGEDRDPHQVVLRQARVVGVAGEGSREVPVAPATIDVAPKQDVFVPFEMTVSDLAPGWYGLECDLDVDGTPGTYPGGKRFSVAWPRASVRRGQLRVDRDVDLGGLVCVRIEQIDCGGDAIKIGLSVDPPEPISVKLAADGARLEVLDVDLDEATGRGRVTAYPLLRTHGALRIELKGRARGAEGAVEVRLP